VSSAGESLEGRRFDPEMFIVRVGPRRRFKLPELQLVRDA
jgi:hypothetical protein